MMTPSASPFTRILMLTFLTLALVFAGLWMRELRQSLSIVQAADGRVQRTAALEASLKEQARVLGEQRSQLRHFAALIDVLASPSSQHWPLASGSPSEGSPSEGSPNAGSPSAGSNQPPPEPVTSGVAPIASSLPPDGRLVLEGGRLGVFAYSLPVESSEQAYQVWMDYGAGRPRSLGLLPRDPDGKRVLFTTTFSASGPIAAKTEGLSEQALLPPTSTDPPLPETLRITLEPRLGSPLPTGPVVLRVQVQ